MCICKFDATTPSHAVLNIHSHLLWSPMICFEMFLAAQSYSSMWPHIKHWIALYTYNLLGNCEIWITALQECKWHKFNSIQNCFWSGCWLCSLLELSPLLSNAWSHPHASCDLNCRIAAYQPFAYQTKLNCCWHKYSQILRAQTLSLNAIGYLAVCCSAERPVILTFPPSSHVVT